LTAADCRRSAGPPDPGHALAELADSGLVIEAIVEDLAAKQDCLPYARSHRSASDCLLCSNTSSTIAHGHRAPR
jgi:3-hydroxybutyryl-CoA dehydrogenase